MRAPDFEDRPASYNNVEFFFSGWSAIDELKAAKAQTLLLNSRLRSRAELIAKLVETSAMLIAKSKMTR